MVMNQKREANQALKIELGGGRENTNNRAANLTWNWQTQGGWKEPGPMNKEKWPNQQQVPIGQVEPSHNV